LPKLGLSLVRGKGAEPIQRLLIKQDWGIPSVDLTAEIDGLPIARNRFLLLSQLWFLGMV